MALDQAIAELSDTLDEDVATPHWRSMVRMRLAAVRDALGDDNPRFRDGWLAARDATSDRARRQLLARLTSLGPRLLERPEVDATYGEVRRLSLDLEHYRQRLHDLVYDSVGIELGGSE